MNTLPFLLFCRISTLSDTCVRQPGVSVPVEKERLVIERKNVTEEAVSPETLHFGDEEVVKVDLYEETATFDKQAFVREEVNIRKEVEHETIQKSEIIRREELEIEEEGNVIQH